MPEHVARSVPETLDEALPVAKRQAGIYDARGRPLPPHVAPMIDVHEDAGRSPGRPRALQVDAAPDPGLWLLARLGMALLLATNAVSALAAPGDFENLLRGNPIGSRIDDGLIRAAIVLAGVNDAVLAILVLARRWRPWVWGWIGAWFAVIAITKLLKLLT